MKKKMNVKALLWGLGSFTFILALELGAQRTGHLRSGPFNGTNVVATAPFMYWIAWAVATGLLCYFCTVNKPGYRAGALSSYAIMGVIFYGLSYHWLHTSGPHASAFPWPFWALWFVAVAAAIYGLATIGQNPRTL